MKIDSSTRFKYLPQLPSEAVWGFQIKDFGSIRIPAGATYPFQGHPDSYTFRWESGRTLQEYQIVYISRGSGVFETHSSGKINVKAGQLFILFPGIWHRYRPNPNTGWEENWIGFSGDYVHSIMSHFFTPTKPLLKISDNSQIPRLIHKLISRLQKNAPKALDTISIPLLEVIASLCHSKTQNQSLSNSRWAAIRMDILKRSTQKINWRQFASTHGLSYVTFRREFHQVTGRSPLEYQIEIRIRRAIELLTRTNLTTKVIAEQLGYQNLYFFSRQFKNKTGHPPSFYRNP